MNRPHILVAFAMLFAAVLLAFSFRAFTRRFDQELMTGKVARRAYATVLAKQWDAAGARGTGRGMIKFSIYQFDSTEHPSKTGWELDTKAAERLMRAEQRVGIRSRDVEPSLYGEIEEGDHVTVLYRLASQDSIEIINIEGVYAKRH